MMEQGASEMDACWMVDIQIRPEPIGECIVSDLQSKQRLAVILYSTMKTNNVPFLSNSEVNVTRPIHL